MNIEKRWIVPEIDKARCDRLSREASCSTLLAAILLRRGINDGDEAEKFLSPKLLQLSDPAELPDMEKAVSRIERGVQERERIAVFGDYDVDGVSSTCLLLDFFRLLDYPVDWRLPRRLEEGYGLRSGTVRELADQGVQLLITVDNGSSSKDEIALAGELGMDVVVTDHHQPADEPPHPAAFVNPWLKRDDKAFRELAGVGVVFKLVWALCQRFSRTKKMSPEFREFLLDSLALVALGTIADVVPLHGENRVLARFGLAALEKSKRPGIRRMVESVYRPREPHSKIKASHVGFGLGPRLNAVGRLGRADVAIQLLMTEDAEEATRLLAHIERENNQRRRIESEILNAARQRARSEIDLSTERVIVLGDPAWHVGVVGIVASRLVEEFFRPTVLFSLSGEKSRGSARSIPGVNITEALARCQTCLNSYGGHRMAAGLEIDATRLQELRYSLNEAIEVSPTDMIPEVEADCNVGLTEITGELLDDFERLAPHGEGNPEPLLAARDLEVVGRPKAMGADGKHLSFYVRENGRALRAVAFGKGEYAARIQGRGARVSLLFKPTWNYWQGRKDIELNVREIRVCSS